MFSAQACPQCGGTDPQSEADAAAIMVAVDLRACTDWDPEDYYGSTVHRFNIGATIPWNDRHAADERAAGRDQHHDDLRLAQLGITTIAGTTATGAMLAMDALSADLCVLSTPLLMPRLGAPLFEPDQIITVTAIDSFHICSCWRETTLARRILETSLSWLAPHSDLYVTFETDFDSSPDVPLRIANSGELLTFVAQGHGVLAASRHV